MAASRPKHHAMGAQFNRLRIAIVRGVSNVKQHRPDVRDAALARAME